MYLAVETLMALLEEYLMPSLMELMYSAVLAL